MGAVRFEGVDILDSLGQIMEQVYIHYLKLHLYYLYMRLL